MNQIEVTKLIAVINTAYPTSALAKMDVGMMPAVIASWTSALDDISYEAASAALAGILKSSEFPPSIAELRSACALVTGKRTTKSADDIVRLFFQARGYGINNWERIFQCKGIQLTDDERKFLKEQLDLARDEDAIRAASGQSENADVVRGQLTRAWNMRQERVKKEDAFRPSIIDTFLAHGISGELPE